MGYITPFEKGNALENAVRAIESTILRSFPGYSESAFRIEGKKIVVVDSVRHEIDIHVTVVLGPSYNAIFIFECKNWQEKVGKNEIIVFSEKIKACGAQRGFFVAKSYTLDAVAQAVLDQRIGLLTAVELDPSAVVVPAGFHGIQVGETNAHVTITTPNAKSDFKATPVDLRKASFVLRDSTADLNDYVSAWIAQARDNRCNSFPSTSAMEGLHRLEFSDERTFEDHEALIDGGPVKSMQLRGTVQVHVSKAVVVSAFEVATRGRVITVQVNVPMAQLRAEFVEIPATEESSLPNKALHPPAGGRG